MSAKLSYEEVRRLARIWFADAHEKSERDEAEVVASKEPRKRNSCSGAPSDAFDNSGSADGDDQPRARQ